MMKQVASETVVVAKERVSALLDGELDQSQAQATIGAVCRDPSLRQAWHELHLAGDALRSHEVATYDAHGFCARVAAAIASEPTILAPRAVRRGSRRYWIPAVAVAASVAVIGFGAVPLLRTPETPMIAKSAPSVDVAAEAAAQKALPTIANARELNARISPYLAAHRELTGGTVVPRPLVYLRSAEDR
jgi:sigma-E factor negative regulatory protein RseA